MFFLFSQIDVFLKLYFWQLCFFLTNFNLDCHEILAGPKRLIELSLPAPYMIHLSAFGWLRLLIWFRVCLREG